MKRTVILCLRVNLIPLSDSGIEINIKYYFFVKLPVHIAHFGLNKTATAFVQLSIVFHLFN